MSTVTPNLGLVKPTTLEQYALSILNNNSDIIDASAVLIDTAASTANWTNFSFLGSVFTRVRIGTKGVVIAHVLALVDTAHALPINTAAGANYGAVIPAGYRPKIRQSYFTSIQHDATHGDAVQTSLETNGDWVVRSNGGSALTVTFAATIHCYCVYEWDGAL